MRKRNIMEGLSGRAPGIIGKILRRTLAGIATLACFVSIFAQPAPEASGEFVHENAPKVTATLDHDSIGIGDHILLTVTVEKDLVQQVGFPQFKEGRINEHIEVLADPPFDTTAVEGRRVTFTKKYLLTTFDEGAYSLGRFPVIYVDKNITDTIWSADPLTLEVGTFEIDTLTQTIYDIKAPVAAPFRIGEIAGWMLLGIFILALIAGGIYLWKHHRNRIPFLAPKPALPPHVAAIRALEALHHQKLWQNNKHKQYYTILVDILREYLSGRYGIRAMEMTSEETVGAVRLLGLPEKLFSELSALLYTSDLVKFAKFVPEADDNETAYFNAYYFVEETKEVSETVSENPDEPQVPAEESAETGKEAGS